MRVRLLFPALAALAAALLGAHRAQAAEADLYCLTGSPPGTPWQPASGANPCPVTATATVGVLGVTTANGSSTIAVTNTFQQVFASNTGRKGCTVQNNGANAMYVFFGAIGGASKNAAVTLSVGQSVNCAIGGLAVATDQVSITGTATDVFYAGQQ